MATQRYSQNLVDAVCDDDRAWFEQHPWAPWRYRPYVPGEVAPVQGAELELICECGQPIGTLVIAVEPGVRLRQPKYEHDRPGSTLRCSDRQVGVVIPHG